MTTLGRAFAGVLLVAQLRCSDVRVEDGSGGEELGAAAVDGGGGAAGSPVGAASVVGGSGGEASGAGGSAGAGGMTQPVLPPLPPCFPAVVDDFSDASASASKWLAANVSFVSGTAVLGAANADLALLQSQAVLPAQCFVSFEFGALEPDGPFDLYVLLKPSNGPNKNLDDVDLNVSGEQVRLYARPDGPYGESQPSVGNRALLIVEGFDVRAYQSNLAGEDWLFVTSLQLPYSFAEGETKLQVVRYDGLPAFWVDDASVLPDSLILTFPGP
jgi:hypothetical protein